MLAVSHSPDSIELDGEEIACLGMRRANPWANEILERTPWRLVSAYRSGTITCRFPAMARKAQEPRRQRKPRKPSIRTLVKQAERATGKTVTSITTSDGTTLHFGEPEPTEATNPW